MMNLTKSAVNVFTKFKGNKSLSLQSSYYWTYIAGHDVTNLSDAFMVFDEMSYETPPPSVKKFNDLLRACNDMEQFGYSLNFFKRMCSLGIPVDYHTMNVLVDSCCKMGSTKKDGFVVLGSFMKKGIVPDVFTFSRMLNGLVREDKIVEAERLFKKLIDKGVCEPNVTMYNTLIKGLCKLGGTVNVTKAVGLIRLMDKRGCMHNQVGYGTVVDGLCKEHLVDEAFELFKEMVDKQGIPPTVVTCNSMIYGFCDSGRWDEASNIVKAMMNGSISPNLQTFNILVNEYCKKDKVEKAEEIMCVMQEQCISPDTVTFSSVLDCYCKRGDMTNAKRILGLMQKNGCQPSNDAYKLL